MVFTRNTTDALNLLATAVPGAVLCLDVEHHANLLPWRSARADAAHRTLPAASTVEETLAALEAALRATPTALLTVTGASNVTGEVLPLRRIAAIAHAAGARVAVDAAQLAPHRRVDLAATGVDYVALSGHKLYAPYGAGALIGRRDWLDAAAPYLAGGGRRHAGRPGRARRGRPRRTGTRRARRTCSASPRSRRPAGRWRRCSGRRSGPGARARAARPARRRPGDGPRRDAAADLARQPGPRGGAELHGRGVLSGIRRRLPVGRARHRGARRQVLRPPARSRGCAGLRTGGDGTAVRASIGLGTTAEHVDRLVDALRELVTRGARWTYAPAGGRWAPTPDPRDLDPLGVGAPGTTGTGCGHPG